MSNSANDFKNIKRERVHGYLRRGMKQGEISVLLGISKQLVHYYAKKFRKNK